MATVANKSYPLREYPVIICTDLTTTNLTATTLSGSTFYPPTGSASGSLVASLSMAVKITGSTYYVQLWK